MIRKSLWKSRPDGAGDFAVTPAAGTNAQLARAEVEAGNHAHGGCAWPAAQPRTAGPNSSKVAMAYWVAYRTSLKRKKPLEIRGLVHLSGGERGIRTPEARFRRLHTFQACSFNHSDTSPCLPDRGRTGPQILAVAGPYHKLNLPAAVAETGHGTISAQTEPVARCLISFSPASGARSVLPNS